jgi:hypothetical protein
MSVDLWLVWRLRQAVPLAALGIEAGGQRLRRDGEVPWHGVPS